MKDLNDEAFISLFKEACLKCFGHPLTEMLSETESKHLSNTILETTGLVIGAKSIKNYSAYVSTPEDNKRENPSTATLDTLARYVLDAPYTDEVKRKDTEGHHPYWFKYKSGFSGQEAGHRHEKSRSWKLFIAACLAILAGIAAWIGIRFLNQERTINFKEDFHSVNTDTLLSHDWLIKNTDAAWWKKAGEKHGVLTLYTLEGDNWADSTHQPAIKNLLVHPLPSDCFTAELHFSGFFPSQNWQQTGLLLLEDNTLRGRSLRISLAYNDFFGGYKKPGEIIIQAISSDKNDLSKPEEIAHLHLSDLTTSDTALVHQNMQHAALKIEKKGNRYRFLYATGAMTNFAYREVLNKNIDFTPHYIGIFALQGFVAQQHPIPVRIQYLGISSDQCEQ